MLPLMAGQQTAEDPLSFVSCLVELLMCGDVLDLFLQETVRGTL